MRRRNYSDNMKNIGNQYFDHIPEDQKKGEYSVSVPSVFTTLLQSYGPLAHICDFTCTTLGANLRARHRGVCGIGLGARRQGREDEGVPLL